MFGSIILLFFTESLIACMYGKLTVCEAYSKADYVVTGKINVLEGSSDSNQKVKIQVQETYKGIKKKEIIFTEYYSNCFWDFTEDEGNSILIYLKYNKKEKNYDFLLGAGGNIKKQNDDLYWLNKLPESLKRTRISGTIEHYEGSGYDFKFIDFLMGTKVKIVGDSKTYDVLTDQNGVYEIWDVPTGKYKIVPEFSNNYELDFPLSKGIIESRQISKDQVDDKDFKVEIKPKGCGGSDYIVNKITK